MEIVKASLDRITGNFAVVYSDDGRKFDVALEVLPRDCPAGSRLVLHLDSGTMSKIEPDLESSRDARKRISEKHSRLLRGGHL
ncbi:MAG: hypothetical protein DA330_01465 [Nitrososphaera sp.]|nr:hypothetical protein [Nitrososphaera sp.]